MDAPHLGEQLRQRRLARGLSLASLAKRADTSAATLSRYENGWQRFEVQTLRKLARALGCRLRLEFEPLPATAPGSPTAAAVCDQLRRLFWDTSLTVDHLRTHPRWVTQRVLELGTLDDVHVLTAHLGRDRMLELVSEMRFSSPPTASLWRAILTKEGVPCRNVSCRPTAGNSWPG